jgi:hypothetical protein
MTLQALLGVSLPVIQAPMAGVQGSALTVAVSNAGGLGSLPCALLGLEALREELEAIRAQTAQPYNVNFFCHAQPQPSIEREAAWRALLAPYFAEFDIDPEMMEVGSGRLSFGKDTADLLSEYKPPVDSLRAWFTRGDFSVLGEITAQYAGISADDPVLDAIWALAEELDFPVNIHIGTGPLGAPHAAWPAYRARLHSPLQLEEVLVRHPGLRVFIGHAAWPMLDELLAVLWTHPQLYVDVSVINWACPGRNFTATCAGLLKPVSGSASCSARIRWCGLMPSNWPSTQSKPQTFSPWSRSGTSSITTQLDFSA